jgi:DNA-binding CsgD family transcriptional regulator
LWLLEALTDGNLEGLESCLDAGMLRADRDAVGFRHEIARVAIDETLPPDRRLTLHRRALAALVAAPAGRADLARLAHHAAAAGDDAAVLEYAPAAAARAATVGAHREAAAQYALALEHAGALSSEARADLLEGRSYECYLTDAIGEAIAARRAALAEHHARGDRLREGDAHRWLSRLAWFDADKATAWAEARQAIELLETLPPGPELAMAYSNQSQLCMLDNDGVEAIKWGNRTIALAEQLDERDVLVHALNNVGTSELMIGVAGGAEKLERSLSLALEFGLEEHAARAYTNLGAVYVHAYDLEVGDRFLDEGIAYCQDHDLDSWRVYMCGWRALSSLRQGRWDDAAADAAFVLERDDVAKPSRVTALAVLGVLRARRGDPDPWEPLDEAKRLADDTGELQRLGMVAVSRAEARWLAGEADEVRSETEAALAASIATRDIWFTGELLAWRRRAGVPEAKAAPTVKIPEPFSIELAGDAEAAAKRWRELGCPYAAALAWAETGDEERQREAIAELTELGAHRAAAHVARMLRKQGVRNLRRGPRASTRANPAGLTAREVDVLELLAEGLTNPEMAERLVLSQKTVEHHVSAVMRKLDARTRTQAVAQARRLGIGET